MNKTKQISKQKLENNKLVSTSKKVTNQFKTLYKIVREIRRQNQHQVNSRKINKNNNQKYTHLISIQDSLDNYQLSNQQQNKQNSTNRIQQTHKKLLTKKIVNHNRANSCPEIKLFNNSIKFEKPIHLFKKFINEEEGKKTLKKISTLHRKNTQIDRSSIGYSLTLQDKTAITEQSLPTQQLSLLPSNPTTNKNPSYLLPHLYHIQSDTYFQTKLSQQIKIYDLNQQLKKLHQQTQNIKIKQFVMENLTITFHNNHSHSLQNFISIT